MWLLHFLPDSFILFIVYLVLTAGGILTALSYLIKWIPGISTYKLPMRIGGIVLLICGVYFYGGYSTEMIWRARVEEMEQKVAAAEQQSKKENTKIVTKLVTKTQVIKTRGEDIVKYVDREIVKYDTKFAPGGVCEIPKEFIKALNDAAEPPK
jgi:L-lactate permease